MPLLVHIAMVWIAGCAIGVTSGDGGWSTSTRLVVGSGLGLVVALVVAQGDRSLSGARLNTEQPFWRDARLLALMLIGGAAVLLGQAELQWNHSCRRWVAGTLAAGQPVRVSLEADLIPPARAQGIAVVASCRVPVWVRATSGRLAAGVWGTLQGTGQPTDRGLRVDGAVHPAAPERFELARRFRGRAGQHIDALFGGHAPVVRALLIADQAAIPPSLRDQFAQAGLVHLLSISGLHVAIIAGALQTLGSALRLSRLVATLTSLLVCAGYVVLLGAPAPAVRSAVMLAVVALAEHRQQPVHAWTALALGAIIPTAPQPSVVADLGWQLSVSGMAALVAARALLHRWRHGDPARPRHGIALRCTRWLQRLHGWRRALLREIVTGIVATLVTAPLVAWTFGRISCIAPFSNLLAGPVVAVIQPGLFLALLLAPWPSVASWVADAMRPPLALLNGIAAQSAAVPYASLAVAPTALGALCAALASAAVVRASAARRSLPALLVAALALTGAVWAPTIVAPSGRLELHVLDVGQGDALALRTPAGRWVLVDAGRRWDGGDAGRRTVVPYVQARGGPVAAFILTHPHDDHAGGAASVLTALTPRLWWEPAFVTPSGTYAELLRTGMARNIPWHRVHPNDQWALDGVSLQVLAPDSAWTASQENANETSVVLRVAYGDIVFLLTGDAQAEEEAWMLAHTDPALLRADLLKVGHHGSRTSSSPPFLAVVQPRLGVISVGAGNRYGHPASAVLARFASEGIPVLRTDLEGTFVISTDGHRLDVAAGGEHWSVPPRRGRR